MMLTTAAAAPPQRLLVVDDDEHIRTLLSWQLEAEGYTVRCVGDGAAALDTIDTDRPDLIVLDLSLPGIGGLDVLRRLRTGGSSGPAVIVLSGRSGETDRIVGLDLGADDYLIKPFSPGELAARVRSVLRRAARAETLCPDGNAELHVERGTREVLVRGHGVELTAKEFDLLAFLHDHPRRVFSRSQLLEHVWDGAEWRDEATVTEHVHRIRGKIEEDPVRPRWVRTVRGVGYRFEP
jgi:DNA-binding response OmpR family regulator